MIPLALLALHADTEPPHVVRGGDLLAALAREANVALDVPDVLAEHRIYLDRKGAPPLVAIQSVALAVNASLVRRKEGYSIDRTPEDLKAIRARRLAARETWFRKRLEQIAAYRKANGGSSENLVAAFSHDAEARKDVAKGVRADYPTTGPFLMMPASTLLEGIVARIGPSTLAAIPSGETRVYEDAPVPSATALPKHDDLMAAYVAEVNRLGERDLLDRVGTTDALGLVRKLPASPTAATRLRLGCEASENGLTIRLEAYDRLGRRLDQAGLFVGSADGLSQPGTLTREAAKLPQSSWTALSPSARRMIEALKTYPLGALPDWFPDPVTRDPLDGFVREEVAGLVSNESGCVAYDVSDSLWSLLQDCVVEGRVSLDAIQKTLEMYLPTQRLPEARITAWRLLDPEADEARRADRAVLRAFARKCVVGKLPELRATCHLFHDASRRVGALADAWWSIALETVPPPGPKSLSPQAYAFLGAIPDPRWNRLRAGETISASRLGVKDALGRLFSEGYGFTVQGDGPVPELFSHPLELYPAGDLGDTPVALSASREFMVRVWSTDKPEEAPWSPLSVLDTFLEPSPSWFRVREGRIVTHMNQERYEAQFARLRFRNGARENARIVLGLPRGLRNVWELPGPVAPEARTFAYGDLPEKVRQANWEKAYREGLAAAQKRLDASP